MIFTSSLNFTLGSQPSFLFGISNQQVNFGRTLVAGVIVDVFFPIQIQQTKGHPDELLHRMSFVGRYHIVIRLAQR